MIEKDVFMVFQVQKRALARMEAGSRKYGSFSPSSDQRDLYSELEDELLDVMNYAAMQILKFRAMREQALTTDSLDSTLRPPRNQDP